MSIVKVLANDITHPVRPTNLFGYSLPSTALIIVCHNEPTLQCGGDLLQITCTEANMNVVPALVGL
jgi:hypothetical protein